MNQILVTKDANSKKSSNVFSRFFKLQFVFSLIIFFALAIFIVYYIFLLQKKEKLSKQIIGNYEVFKLYQSQKIDEDISKNKNSNSVFGILKIPKIDLYYPIFSDYDEEKLKISLCKFHGESLSKNDNICIAGHNYNNSMFFSKLNLLDLQDEIFLYDSSGNSYLYHVFKIYEVKSSDLSPISNENSYDKELTLVTCNNLNDNRFIVKAKQ